MTSTKIETKELDFIATLIYKPTNLGGRKTPAVSGYRPHIKFDFDEMRTSGQQVFLNKDLVLPGDTVEAEIRIIAVDYFAHRLSEGMLFEFGEGSTIIGTGEIIQIVNQRLKKASR